MAIVLLWPQQAKDNEMLWVITQTFLNHFHFSFLRIAWSCLICASYWESFSADLLLCCVIFSNKYCQCERVLLWFYLFTVCNWTENISEWLWVCVRPRYRETKNKTTTQRLQYGRNLRRMNEKKLFMHNWCVWINKQVVSQANELLNVLACGKSIDERITKMKTLQTRSMKNWAPDNRNAGVCSDLRRM